MTDFPSLARILNVVGLSLAFLGSLMLARPWRRILLRYELAENRRARARALRAADRQARGLDSTTGSPDLIETAHDLYRRTNGLSPRSLLSSPGTLDREQVNSSFDEVEAKIRGDYQKYAPRDISGAAVWLLSIGFLLQLIAAV